MFNPIYHSGLPVQINNHSWQSKDLVGWWPTLPQSPGKAGESLRDYGGFSRDGSLVADTKWDHSWHFGRCLSFDGTGDWVDFSFNVYDWGIRQHATFAAWFNMSSGFLHTICGDYDNLKGFAMRVNDSTTLDFFIYPNNHRITPTVSTLSLGTWYHMAGVMAGANMYFYFNGDQLGSQTLGEDIGDSAKSLKLGTRGDNVQPTNGLVSDFRIYDRAFSAGEVAALYNPATRWDLYKQPRRIVGKAPAAAAQTEGPLVKGRLIRGGSLSGALVR